MLAAYITRYGGPLVVGTLPQPSAASLEDGFVIVKVHVVALNPVDVATLHGKLGHVSGPPSQARPDILGYDCAGVIEAIGPGVSRSWAVGDEVMCVAVRGALCTHATVHHEQLARKPRGMPFADAAALVTAGLTAWQMLEAAGALSGGGVNRLLITAGGGGVGHYAIQLAKRVAKVRSVVATASAGKTAFVRRCGADEVLDYAAASYPAALADLAADAALDCKGVKCVPAVRPGGIVVSLLGLPDGATLRAITAAYHMQPPPCLCCIAGVLTCIARCRSCCSSVRVHNLITLPHGGELEALAATCLRSGVVPSVDRVFTLDDAAAALAYVELGHTTGKVLVEVVDGAVARRPPERE